MTIGDGIVAVSIASIIIIVLKTKQLDSISKDVKFLVTGRE